ncbi:hypothetical protein EG68_05320 [Paragonimus skrjabini miyazakii]|uniref:Uncharacterized protein n=1 Tax=Paragonimus skrjabini miyazakii TaxID=59628 RepID=A0A8S9YUT6_9TREM|nr:hypothetical protein EG68_05320 [Paragonimus skrjabini miyazakii]
MTGALLVFRVRLQDLYTLRNAIYRCLSILKNGYDGTYLGISNDAERVPPCESLPLLNFGMGMFYFTKEEDAKRFVHSDQGFMEADFLDNAEVFIVPVQRPILVGSHGAAFLFTETKKAENYSQLPNPEVMFRMQECGAVPLVADSAKVYLVRGCNEGVCGIRVSQFPNKKIFYEWVKSDCGSNFREEMCKVRSLNSYVATFARDLF